MVFRSDVQLRHCTKLQINSLKNKLQELLNKSQWTEQEKQWLLTYLEQTGAEDDELKVLMLQHFNQIQSDPIDPALSKKLLNNIHERIAIKQSPVKIPASTIWMRKLAAASLIGLLALGSYFWLKPDKNIGTAQNKTVKERSKPVGNDVAPGGNKAMLMLADGSTIVLDEAQDGALVQQGNTKVIKLKGRLAYNTSKSGSAEILYNTISTPRGGEYQVELPDGTRVWLNAASSLRFPTAFSGKERRVEITGEAYFEVAKNKAVPFVVKVQNAEVQVLGTHFNIMGYSEEAELQTTLLEGSVKFVSGGVNRRLKPGQQSLLAKSGQISIDNNVDVEEVVAWKNGLFHFESEEIETVMRQLSRWYDVEVIYQTKKINDLFYADIPRNTKLSDVLKALELTGKVHFDIEGKKIIVI